MSNPQEFWLACVQPRLAQIQKMPSLDKPSGAARARQMLEDELAAVCLAICALNTQHNALVPVSWLPAEILARVFLFYADMEPPDRPHYQLKGGSLGWIRVTHVCKYWRQTGVNYPHLWTTFKTNLKKPLLSMMLERAKSAPLSIDVRYSMSIAQRREIFKHGPRIQDIRVCENITAATVPTLQLLLTSPANVLQHLFLVQFDHRVVWLSDHTFQDHAPMLRSVNLWNVYIRWSAPILRNLTCLRVNVGPKFRDADAEHVVLDEQSVPNPSDDAFATSSFRRLLDALRRMPAVETLHLTHCLPPGSRDSENSNGAGIVDLPCLKVLELTDVTARVSDLIKCIGIPPSCGLDLDCREDVGLGSATELASFFRAHLDREQVPLQSLVIFDDEAYLRFYIPRKDPSHPAYKIQLPCLQGTNSSWDALDTLCRSSWTDSILHLDFSPCRMNGPDWSPQEWVNVLGQCRAVEDVRFNGSLPKALAFCEALTMHVDRGDGELFLENLRCLTLSGFVIDKLGLEAEAGLRATFLERMGARQMVTPIQTVQVCRKQPWTTTNEGFVSSHDWRDWIGSFERSNDRFGN